MSEKAPYTQRPASDATRQTTITAIDASNPVFQRTFLKLGEGIRKEAKRAISDLLLVDVSSAPAKLHLHPLKSKMVTSAVDGKKKVKVFTFHITSSDSHKASFTLEDGTAYLRACGPHDEIDKTP
ncbi:hypothetical protein [uncultured Zoogloea sp.]|uniref:hypothetical protein n=1 Tax=uncultured Zoogloea sp. TaxID=160237 RepID=UPI002636225A|nr:hypothetical protein [uncultured Zoogloea sp.]